MPFDIDPAKITQYLLTRHPGASEIAAGKSKFFHGVGYRLQDWIILRDDLLQHPVTALLERTVSEPRPKLIYRCSMPTAPNGKVYCVRTVWTAREGVYWLSTAYPQ